MKKTSAARLASAMHAIMRDKLKGWEEDMRLLAQQAPVPADLNRSR